MRTHEWDVGEQIHGFAGGAFGRDSYGCRRVEAIGHDWIVTRTDEGKVEFVGGDRIPAHADCDRSECRCTGRGWLD